MRNAQAEIEMLALCREIWPYMKPDRKFPKILSKQGGSSGCYYPAEHSVYFRWNVWNKMPLAGKRMLVIHELYHAAGNNHQSQYMFCHAFDILTIELYKLIYGEDKPYQEAVANIKALI